jgi:oxygen-independent coproporphyrinogen-3 oxidase
VTIKTTATTVPIELLRKYDRPGPRYTSYPTAPIWSEEVGSTDYIDALKTVSSKADVPLSLYCHVPFCRTRCYYCGCNTCIVKKASSVDGYVDALIEEIETTSAHLKPRRAVSQLHFGGGTPTFVGTDRLRRILDALESNFTFVDGCEKSIEVDPRVTTSEQLDFLAGRDFNRISLGVQDFNAEVQQAIGRVQPFEKVATILEECRRLDFKGINFDLIYGLPLQTVDTFVETIDKVISLRPDRLAVYSFAYLPKLKAHQSKIEATDLPDTDVKYQLFAAAIEKFTGAGYHQIGMDHFALPDDELSLAREDGRLYRNFMGYSVQSAPDMIGFGMSSIGYVDNGFFQNVSRLNEYGRQVAVDGLAVYRGMKLSNDDLIRQHLITSLMCNFGLDNAQLKERFAVNYADYFADEHKRLSGFFDDGLLEQTAGGLEVTPVGRAFVRNIAMTFDAYLADDSRGKKATYSRTI